MKTKRFIRAPLLLLALTLALCVSLLAPVFADTGMESSTSVDNQDFNLVLLIDRSGSMKKTDRSRLVQDAARLFVDLCDEGRDSHIAVMSFDTSVTNNGFLTVSDAAQRDQLKQQISEISYDDGGTDIGLALLSAVDYIAEESSPARKNLIVLFTDGYTQDLVNRTVADSEADLQKALEKAVENNCRIFTIGTNYNGSMKENGRIALEGIRDYQLENGASNTPEELLAVIDATDQDGMKAVTAEFERIYATIGNRIIHEGNLVIESTNISEANIIISAPDGVSEVVVTAPSGNSVSIPLDGSEVELDGAKLVFKAGQAYQLIKIVEPIPVGTWILNVADNQSNPILNYTWMLTTKAEISVTMKQKTKHSVLVSVKPENIEPTRIADFYNSLTERSVVVTKVGDEGNPTVMELNYNTGALSMIASFSVEPSTSYTVTVKVSDDYFIRSCTGTIDIPETWTPIEEEGSNFGTIYVWNWSSDTIDLSERVDLDVQDCESVDGGDDLAYIELDGTNIKVQSITAGSEQIRIESVLADGSKVELTGKLRILNPIYPIFGGLLLLAGLIFLIYKKASNRVLRGTYFQQFNLRLGDEHQYTLPEVQIPHCKVFTLYDLVDSYRHDLMVPNLAKVLEKKVLDKRSPYYKALKKISFRVCRDSQSFKSGDTLYKRHATSYDWKSEDDSLSLSFHY